MAALVFSSTGTLVLAGSGLTPARLLLVPAGTRLPPGVLPVAAVPARATGHAITARASLPVGGGDATKEAALAILSVGDATVEGALASISLPVGNATREGVLASLPVDYVTKGALASLPVGNATANEGALDSLSVSVGEATRAAAGGGPSRGSARPGVLFFGIPSPALATAAGGRASRGGRLVVAAAAGSEADGEVDDNDGYSAKVDLFLKKKEEVLFSWEYVDVYRNYGPHGFFADVEMFKESATKGMILMRLLLDRGLDYTNDQMWVLSYAGQCLSRVAIQAEDGFVYDGAVREATQAVKLVCLKLVPDVAMASAADPIVAYANQRADDFVNLIDGVKAAVVTD